MVGKRLLLLLPIAVAAGSLMLLLSRSISATGLGTHTSNVLPPVRIQQLLRTGATTSGGAITLREGPAEVVAARYRIAPRAALPIHKHPAPRFGYVLSGTLMVTNAETHGFRIFTAGDFIAEDVGTWHEARNPEAKPVELLVIDLVRPGAENVVPGR